jgi:hypothetical protein
MPAHEEKVMHDLKSIARWGGICGLLGAVVYIGLIVASQWMPGSEAATTAEALAEWGRPENRRWVMLPHMSVLAFAMLWMVGMVALEQVLQCDPGRPSSDRQRKFGPAYFGQLFAIVGFATLVAMLMVQGAVQTLLAQEYVGATGETERQGLIQLYRGLRSIDLGLDLAWDGFIFVAIVLMGWAMVRHPWFGRLLGGAGIAVGLGALTANAWAAPEPPAFDWGPLCGLWIVAVNVRMLVLSRRELKD